MIAYTIYLALPEMLTPLAKRYGGPMFQSGIDHAAGVAYFKALIAVPDDTSREAAVKLFLQLTGLVSYTSCRAIERPSMDRPDAVYENGNNWPFPQYADAALIQSGTLTIEPVSPSPDVLTGPMVLAAIEPFTDRLPDVTDADVAELRRVRDLIKREMGKV